MCECQKQLRLLAPCLLSGRGPPEVGCFEFLPLRLDVLTTIRVIKNIMSNCSKIIMVINGNIYHIAARWTTILVN